MLRNFFYKKIKERRGEESKSLTAADQGELFFSELNFLTGAEEREGKFCV